MTQHIGQRLRQWRTEQGLTQHQVALRARTTKSIIAAIEDGIVPADSTRSKIEALIGPPPSTDWRTVASDLDAQCARLADENRQLRAEIETLRTALRTTAGHTHNVSEILASVAHHDD